MLLAFPFLQKFPVPIVGSTGPIPKDKETTEISFVMGVVIIVGRGAVHATYETERGKWERKVVAAVSVNTLPQF